MRSTMRSAARPAGLGALLAALLLPGCPDTGDMPPWDARVDLALDEAGEDDASEEPQDDPAGDGDLEDCVPEQTPTGSAAHEPGTDCNACHVIYPPYLTVGGTLFADPAGSLPVQGATVVLVDSAGSEIRLVSHFTGNFFTDAAVTFPATVSVSLCPDTVIMSTPVTDGSCNRCHGFGSRIHIP